MNNLHNVPFSKFEAACEAATRAELISFLFDPREYEGNAPRTPRTGDDFDRIAIAVLDRLDENEWRVLAPHERTPEAHTG